MKKVLLLVLLLTACTYQQTISSYHKIDTNARTVAVDSTNMTDIHFDFKRALTEAGFEIYNKNNNGYAARYELSDDIHKDDNVRCGLWEEGYTYEITFIDKVKKAEAFGIQGQGCRENILKDFTALINNRYDEKEKTIDKSENSDAMKVPTLRSDGRTWWGN